MPTESGYIRIPWFGKIRFNKRKLLIIFAASFVFSIVMSTVWPTLPLQQALVQAGYKNIDEIDPALADESTEIQAVLLSYWQYNHALFLKAEAALLNRPVLAREIIPEYGYSPEFRHILLKYGDSVLAPISYFQENRIYTLLPQHYAREVYSALFGGRTGGELSAERRGWYAIYFIQREGHRLLSQFVTDSHGNVHWIQSSRVIEDLSSFFAGGIRNLETKWRSDEHIRTMDVAWAAVDVIPFLAAGKLMKLGKAAELGSREARLVSADAGAIAKDTRVVDDAVHAGTNDAKTVAKDSKSEAKSVAKDGGHGAKRAGKLSTGAKSAMRWVTGHPKTVLFLGLVGAIKFPSRSIPN